MSYTLCSVNFNAKGVDARLTRWVSFPISLILQTYKGPGDFEYSIVGTANPLDKDGTRSAFIEEARCHLEVSLVILYDGIDKLQEDDALEKNYPLLEQSDKIAGGDILSFEKPAFIKF